MPRSIALVDKGELSRGAAVGSFAMIKVRGLGSWPADEDDSALEDERRCLDRAVAYSLRLASRKASSSALRLGGPSFGAGTEGRDIGTSFAGGCFVVRRVVAELARLSTTTTPLAFGAPVCCSLVDGGRVGCSVRPLGV
jgi:hypothetical protein